MTGEQLELDLNYPPPDSFIYYQPYLPLLVSYQDPDGCFRTDWYPEYILRMCPKRKSIFGQQSELEFK